MLAPNLTAMAPVKLVPVSMTPELPASGPPLGNIAVTEGGAWACARLAQPKITAYSNRQAMQRIHHAKAPIPIARRQEKFPDAATAEVVACNGFGQPISRPGRRWNMEFLGILIGNEDRCCPVGQWTFRTNPLLWHRDIWRDSFVIAYGK
ncbi:MAG: hypothetical protein WA924_02080 [Burkholderiaceae bacterium]